MNPKLFRSVRCLVDAVLIGVVLAVLPFAWILRDGLGPDSVESSGWEAIWRCLRTFHTGYLLVLLILLSGGLRWLGRQPGVGA